MKFFDRFKNMDKQAKFTMIFSVLILILLAVQIYLNGAYIASYTDRVNYGNERWDQVDKRITEYEHKIELLEKDIELLTVKQGGN